jgi:nicotinate-nucleotide adenylyltransferase
MGIGLLGGSFDPVHLGHLRTAEEVRESFSLERIFFVPAGIQPFKQQTRAADASDRVRMIEMAIRGNDFFRVSALEIKRGGVSYTIDTVRSFARKYGEVYFLVGIDAFSDIAQWKAHGDLFLHAHFVVMARPGRKAMALPEDLRHEVVALDEMTWEHRSGKRIYVHKATQLDISSTMVRELLKTGRSVKYLVPESVERYIKKRGLYIN